MLCIPLRVFAVAASLLLLGAASGGQRTESKSAEVNRLIKQLGSTDFSEREQASKALEAIGQPALSALREAGRGRDLEIVLRAKRLVEVLENRLDCLLCEYRDYGLPLPPQNAELVKFESAWSIAGEGGKNIPIYNIGFVIRPAKDNRQVRLLVGTQEVELDGRSAKPQSLDPAMATSAGIDPCSRHQTLWMNAGLATALQCKSRGWDRLAEDLFESSRMADCGHHFSRFYHPAGLPPRRALAYLAWTHWGNELSKPHTDRNEIARRMRALLAAEPTLNIASNQTLLKSLDLALIPSKAKPGSVEALIDGLVESTDSDLGTRQDQVDSCYTKLAELGFGAVPALIEHLDDERLTRCVASGFGNFPPHHIRVNRVVTHLLQELVGEDVSREWIRMNQAVAVEKTTARAWWAKASKVGEEAYLVANVLPTGEKAEWPNHHILGLIAKKYPEHLPGIYRTVLEDRPTMQSCPLAEAVGKSSLAPDKKIELFVRAAESKDLEHRRAAFWELRKCDPERFRAMLIKTLNSLPRTPSEPYWKCCEASFTPLVLEINDPDAWLALARFAKRADVGLRMEVVQRVGYPDKKHPRMQIAFLTEFLEDATVRDVASSAKLFDGPYAASGYSRLEVRDLAAMQIASLLRLPAEPKPEWMPQQWATLREKVREALRESK